MTYETYPMVHLPRGDRPKYSKVSNDYSCLGCPNCKGYNMHHIRARVSFRREDSNEGGVRGRSERRGAYRAHTRV
jgi:hypothetical protein